MNDHPTTTPDIWALLIGVDCYMPATIPDLPRYGNLGGCVNDILLMDAFLRERRNVPAAHIKKLTATVPASGPKHEPQEPPERQPTKANIIAALQALAKPDGPQPGDQVYIHYSGHGGRAVTIRPDIKGKDGLDESLVPTDYGQIVNEAQPEDRYVRDLELAALLQALVDRKLIVTVILDSCHAGGAASRGSMEGVRGSDEIDKIPRVPSTLAGAPDELATIWQAQTRGTRGASVASGWLPDPNGYTLLAACAASELAGEYDRLHPAPNGKQHGYLTYWLWHTLQSPVASWEMVRQQVMSCVHGLNQPQTPQLQGVSRRAVFGGAALALPAGVNILEAQGDRLRLHIGPSDGVGIGAQFFVYRKGVTDFKQTDQRLAVAEVREPVTREDGGMNDAESWAEVLRRLGDGTIEPGCQALLFDPGQKQQRAVQLVRGGAAPADLVEAALANLAMIISRSEEHFVRLAANGEDAYFHVGLTANKEYEIRAVNDQPLANLQPVPVAYPRETAYQLNHLAKYFNVLELSSPDTMSRLAGKLEVTLMRTPDEEFNEPGGTPTVKHTPQGARPGLGQAYYLRIRNLFEPLPGPPSDARDYVAELARRTMNVAVLNLAPDWGINRLLPNVTEPPYYPLEPGQTLLLPPIAPGKSPELPRLYSTVPPGARDNEAIDIFKVFATTDTTDYDSLQLQPLDSALKRAGVDRSPVSPEPERTWITTQVTVRVVK